jgi:alpha/beta superfamily hydrolase
VRPNFRGIGESAGAFDEGQGETEDMFRLVEQFEARYAELAAGAWVLGGFSFGTCVGAQLYARLQANQKRVPQMVIWAGSAVLRFQHGDVAAPPDALVIHGENDDVVPMDEVMRWARPIDMPVVVVPNTGHFFHGKLLILRELVQMRLKCL